MSQVARDTRPIQFRMCTVVLPEVIERLLPNSLDKRSSAEVPPRLLNLLVKEHRVVGPSKPFFATHAVRSHSPALPTRVISVRRRHAQPRSCG